VEFQHSIGFACVYNDPKSSSIPIRQSKMSFFLPGLLPRSFTAPPESQPSRRRLAPRTALKACSCNAKGNFTGISSIALAPRPYGLFPESHHYGFGNYSHIPWQREQSRPPRRLANPSSTQHAPYTEEDTIQGFERLESQSEVPDVDDEMLDLALWAESSTRVSQSPEDSTAQPRTPSPVEAISRFKNRGGVNHEIAAVAVKGESSAESEDALDAEAGPYATKWTRDRLRIRPERFDAVVDEHTDLWMTGTLIKSIERDPTVAPVPNEGLGPSYEYHHQHRSCEASESEEDGYESDEWDVKGITGERIGPGIHEYRIEWQDFEGQCWPLEWIPAENCTNCAESIADFRLLQTESLSAARRAGRTEEVQRLQRLAEAYQIEIDNTVLPRNVGRKINRRSANGRFAARGTNNSVFGIVRKTRRKLPVGDTLFILSMVREHPRRMR
jgi:hypothetical protein